LTANSARASKNSKNCYSETMKILHTSLCLIGLMLSAVSCAISQKYSHLEGNTSPEYDDLISFYKDLASKHDDISLYQMGQSDYGKPIYLCILGSVADSSETFLKARSATTLLINNAIHPGEPCGVNACMQLVVDYSKLTSSQKTTWPVVGIIPAYNVGGMHNRSATSRANQDGPELYGFRGNAQNLDLNRDFIKMDSKNAWTFSKIFHALDPDVFIDTHTSNGADYQHTMTYIAPLANRFDADLTKLVYQDMLPSVEKHMLKNWGYDLFPYVSMNGRTLDKGIHAFNATPRYATGYAELFNTISITTEAHMLKPFEDRVKATYGFISGTIEWMQKNALEIETKRGRAFEKQMEMKHWPIRFEAVKEQNDSIMIKGYQWELRESELTTQPRLYYDRSKPMNLWIPFTNNYQATDTLFVPEHIIVGGQEEAVIRRLNANGIKHYKIETAAESEVVRLRIEDFKSPSTPYEGHFLHSNVKLVQEKTNYTSKAGDILIPVRQRNIAFILHTLYPLNEDSYFVWNFFDSYMQQKEYFSDYVFEEKAIAILNNNPELKKEYLEKQQNDTDFASNRWAQMMWIYQRSDYYEGKTHRVLPVYFIQN
jgi:hypothetical protein